MATGPTRGLIFTKAVACGNDFLIAEESHAQGEIGGLTRKLCDRHLGVGADGVEWISEDGSGSSEIIARLVNADGSEAEISGNGTRCVAAYWFAARGGDTVRIQTGAGIKTCRKLSGTTNEEWFSLNMGEPRLAEEQKVKTGPQEVSGLNVSFGNPHFVVFVENFDFDWRGAGHQIQRSGMFPRGVNVEFVRVRSASIVETRFFERGVGETMSSGTGSCAAAVAAIHTGRCRGGVEVRSPGGPQLVRWEPGHEVVLEGAAKLICSGEFFG